MYINTDSMSFYIKSSDAYYEIRDIKSIQQMFNFSEIPKNYICPGFGFRNYVNCWKVNIIINLKI